MTTITAEFAAIKADLIHKNLTLSEVDLHTVEGRAAATTLLPEIAALQDAYDDAVRAETPTHLLPDACYVCGGRPERHRDSTDSPHRYWSNADALAEARAEDARTVVRYSNGTTSPEAHYIATERPY